MDVGQLEFIRQPTRGNQRYDGIMIGRQFPYVSYVYQYGSEVGGRQPAAKNTYLGR
jgi:hypothetical protein